jgi:hypothetical protein
VRLHYGGLPNVQLHFQPGMAIARVNGTPLKWGPGDTEFGIKYRFIEQDKTSWVPSVAVFPKLEAPTGDAARGLGTGRTQAFFPLWLQKDIGDWTTFGGGGFMALAIKTSGLRVGHWNARLPPTSPSERSCFIKRPIKSEACSRQVLISEGSTISPTITISSSLLEKGSSMRR